jgi:hypothetical protein
MTASLCAYYTDKTNDVTYALILQHARLMIVTIASHEHNKSNENKGDTDVDNERIFWQ